MQHFISVQDVPDLSALVELARYCKANPHAFSHVGRGKALALVFMNPSLRTRLSTARAAQLLGLDILNVDFNATSWSIELRDGAIMDSNKTEHIREAAAVIGSYCDIIGIRDFAELQNYEYDQSEPILSSFKQYGGKPILSLESRLLHPLQSLTDLLTIQELKSKPKPKVVLTWNPHIKALPQAVPHSFVQWMRAADIDLVITHPEGYELDPNIIGNTPVVYNQKEAFQGADFIYAKNWSAFNPYGQVLRADLDWIITPEKLSLTAGAKFMHCLPARRNIVATDAVFDGVNSIVIQQAANRLPAAQAVLKMLLDSNYGS